MTDGEVPKDEINLRDVQSKINLLKEIDRVSKKTIKICIGCILFSIPAFILFIVDTTWTSFLLVSISMSFPVIVLFFIASNGNKKIITKYRLPRNEFNKWSNIYIKYKKIIEEGRFDDEKFIRAIKIASPYTFDSKENKNHANSNESDDCQNEYYSIMKHQWKNKLALEKDYEDFFVQNIEYIEPGLKYITRQDPVGVGELDILAKDENGCFVVIELKKDQGSDKTIGQITRYMGAVKDYYIGDVRGIIVADGFNDKIRSSLKVIQDVKLISYEEIFNQR